MLKVLPPGERNCEPLLYCLAERGNIAELVELNITLPKAEYHLPERQISL